ncbi:unnamed protein product [Vitrella brassicaformis CCMP3155]|uniref:Uncharacterized protein n=1 Tax=Vitrella brassicaformis (strain CCMP3155) TaxID=1169540 RepID=A0A0G4FYR5_VITBC|nr:unnamed protein product [Vitrella brassicaformis CCMP3155]|eukprot:CEM20209.1 unnamed protein product [Vitrella brassicaformis CCMP3155]
MAKKEALQRLRWLVQEKRAASEKQAASEKILPTAFPLDDESGHQDERDADADADAHDEDATDAREGEQQPKTIGVTDGRQAQPGDSGANRRYFWQDKAAQVALREMKWKKQQTIRDQTRDVTYE